MHEDNCFITLTYSESSLPPDESLNVKHWQKFMKRLRHEFKQKKIRFLHCGEYGNTCPKHDTLNCPQCGKLQRPHYHALLFGIDFHDKIPWTLRNGHQTYRSMTLNKLWPQGFHEIGNITFESAAYVAGYAVKKIAGDNAHAHYEKIDAMTGEVYTVRPEYITMSRGGKAADGTNLKGIGYSWYLKYKHDLFPEDECVIDGRIMKPPRYYAKMYEQENPEEYKRIIQARKRFFGKHKQDNTWQRLADREKVTHAKNNQNPRNLEE